ncbi:MAG: T9SS type B sorting domain-containing protein [Bacteroidetes bacterium]|nr:T9SS type B sorting domain-containing protein [Bacteroidota bacterium]
MNRTTFLSLFLPVFFFLFWQNNPQDSLETSTGIDQEDPFCGSMHQHEHRMATDPDYAQAQKDFDKAWKDYALQQHVKADYTLPVVFHIIHNNGPENLADAIVLSGLDHLNDAFENINYYDQNTGVNTQIEFCLAQRDPDGNFTTGINHVQSPLTSMNMDTEDLAVKDLIRWDPTKYINIWIVGEICNANGCSVAGYAYFPSAHGSDVDGIVMEATYLGSSEANSAVLVHEMGHYLGLYHTFQDGCGNNDCLLDGDQICDTPPDQSTVWVPCGSPVNTCNTDADSGFPSDQDDMINNYMDYSDFNCYNAFTANQTDRMTFSITGTRSSLLDSDGCMDPCLNPITASFTPSSTSVNVGDLVTFNNTSIGATTYEWFVDGVSFASTQDANYTFGAEGNYDIELVATNADPNCYETFIITIEVICQVVADFQASSNNVLPGTVVFFDNYSQNAASYEWYLDGNLEATSVGFNYQFDNLGNYDVQLVASDGFCSDTSAISVITVSSTGSAQTGLPIWPMTVGTSDDIELLDWTEDPPLNTSFQTANFDAGGGTGAGFDGCADLVFIVAHTGSSDPDGLNIYAPDGTELLSANTANGPGLNAVRGSQEIQVIRVPNVANEWYIIYNEWVSDVGQPINNGAYAACRMLYSRIRLDGTDLVVLDRDILLTDNVGVAHTYNDGMAVSRTVNGNVDQHYLYATRRAVNQSSLSLDRFIIDQNDITWDANTGTVANSYWNLTHAGSHIELSPTEDRIAVCSRNQFNGWIDYFIFDAVAFNNANVVPIIATDLILVADGTANDLSSVLPYSAPVSTIAADNGVPLSFLNYFGNKLANLEFSPNGRFLYVVNGGYVSGGFSNLTYLAQIDLEANPYEVRLQIQEPPFGTYNASTGLGCQTSNGNCLDSWYGVNAIESSFDGKLYFKKRGKEELFVIPEPNNVMPQNLVPSDIDLSTATAPNIVLAQSTSQLPDQIDGYNYYLSRFQEVEMIVDGVDCNGDCRADYPLEVILNDIVVGNYTIESCPDTIYFCADTTQVYQLYDPSLDISYDSAIVNGMVVYPESEDLFDFSDLEDCTELCANGIDDDNDGLIDCDDPDLQDSCCCLIATDILDLGPDQEVCDNGVVTFNAGSGYASYLWQDFSSDSTFTALFPGTYWVDVLDSCGNVFSDTVIVSELPFTELDLGPDLFYCEGEAAIQFQAGGFDTYLWTPDTYLSCSDCPDPEINPLDDITYIVIGSTDEGCVSVDTIEVIFGDTTLTQLDTAICEGAVFTFDGVDLEPGDSQSFTWQNAAGCDSTILVNVSLNGSMNSMETIDTSACQGSSIVYNGVSINAGETFEFTYQNQAGCDSVILVQVAELQEQETEEFVSICEGDTIIINGTPVFSELTLETTFTGSNGCDSTHTAFVSFYPEIELEIEGEGSCAGAMDGYVNLTPLDGDQPFTYSWSDPALSGTEVSGLAPGPYAVTATDVNGCSKVYTFDLLEYPLPDYSFKLIDVSCPGEADGQIEVVPVSDNLTYSLDGVNFQSASLFTDLEPGLYDLFVQDEYGCIYEDELVLNAPDPLLLNLPPDTIIQLGTSISVNGLVFSSDSLSYQWSPESGLDCPICPTVIAGPLEDTEYTLTVIDEGGCITRETILIQVLKARLLYIPNVFSPNDDGVNDLFYPFGGAGVTEILDFKVFDRWGGLMYSDGGFAPNDPAHGWDGTFRGKKMGTGVYTFFIEVQFDDGVRDIYKGGIQLIR